MIDIFKGGFLTKNFFELQECQSGHLLFSALPLTLTDARISTVPLTSLNFCTFNHIVMTPVFFWTQATTD